MERIDSPQHPKIIQVRNSEEPICPVFLGLRSSTCRLEPALRPVHVSQLGRNL